MKLSVVIPVYNEEATLEEIFRRVLATPHEKEIIAVDDCSSDRSAEILREIAAANDTVRVFSHEKNQGKGAALATGFAQVTGDIVLIQDADLEYDPADYNVLLEPFERGQADVVYGSRFLGGRYGRAHLYWHYVANRILTTLSNIFTNLNLTDMETCYKVFRADVVSRLDLQSKGFAVEPEITCKVAKMKKRVYEVPISYAGRDVSEGKKIRASDGFKAVWAIMYWRLFG